MVCQKYQELEERLRLRNKLLKLGIGCSVVGPTGPRGERGLQGEKGDMGPAGQALPSTNEGLLSIGFLETDTSGVMTYQNPWIIPNPSSYFNLINDSDIEVQPGIYEIVFSGLIKDADDTHGGTFYLQTIEGSAIRDLIFELLPTDGKLMHFSQSIVFRFEDVTTLQVLAEIYGDEHDSNVNITDVNLLMKKIHE